MIILALAYLKTLVVPLIIVSITTIYYFENAQLPPEDLRLVNPIIYSIIILAVIVIIKDFVINKVQNLEVKHETKVKFTKKDLKLPLLIFFTILYLVAIDKLGFLITTFLFMIASMYLLGVRSKTILVVSLCLPLFLFISFSFLLKVPLPTGPATEFIKKIVSLF